jgi:hypothetical protein
LLGEAHLRRDDPGEHPVGVGEQRGVEAPGRHPPARLGHRGGLRERERPRQPELLHRPPLLPANGVSTGRGGTDRSETGEGGLRVLDRRGGLGRRRRLPARGGRRRRRAARLRRGHPRLLPPPVTAAADRGTGRGAAAQRDQREAAMELESKARQSQSRGGRG